MYDAGMSTHTNRWSREDHLAFADGVRLRASSINGRRNPGPSASEWDWDDEDEQS
jgi:hypothetical protein